MIALNRLSPYNLLGYVDGLRQDCLLHVQGVAYGTPPVLANMILVLPTTQYIQNNLRLDVLLGINDQRGDVTVCFRESMDPEERAYMTEEDLVAFLDSGSDEFDIRKDHVWLAPESPQS